MKNTTNSKTHNQKAIQKLYKAIPKPYTRLNKQENI